MFEPTGERLAELVKAHTASANSAFRVAESLRIGGAAAAADVYYSRGLAALSDACICEMALNFEVLGGVS